MHVTTHFLQRHTLPFTKKALLILALIAVAIYAGLSANRLRRYQQLATYPNQACVAVGIGLENGLRPDGYDFNVTADSAPTINTHSAPDGYMGMHKCSAGLIIASHVTESDGSRSDSGYELGSTVQYFRNNDTAYAFAQNSVNKQKYWGVDLNGQSKISQNSLFTFLKTDVPKPYFESYTVQNNFVVFMSLPCDMSGEASNDEKFDKCNLAANKTLREAADRIASTVERDPVFR